MSCFSTSLNLTVPSLKSRLTVPVESQTESRTEGRPKLESMTVSHREGDER